MYPGIHAAADPDRPAIIIGETGSVVTYAELDRRSAGLSVALGDMGLTSGDVVAVLVDNIAEYFDIYWAVMQSGMYITPINRYLSAEEVAYIVNDCDAKVLFCSAVLGEVGKAIVDMTPAVEFRYGIRGPIEGYRDYDALIESYLGRRPSTLPRGAEMMYSSGTTGRPKGIRSASMTIQVTEPGEPLTAILDQRFHIGAKDVYLQPAPIYHGASVKWAAAIHSLGGTVLMMYKFDAELALELIDRYPVTIAQFVPTMFVRMLQLPEENRAKYDVSSMKIAMHSAAPCPPEVKEKMIEWWGSVVGSGTGAVS
ncbi:AMP-binding protein [Nocardia sp. CA-084685]|uniref:AMP-binding protein n=1 Tax=Nocardia sp. CA-084685 TaxID=3239970 RepID=UPI003D963D60